MNLNQSPFPCDATSVFDRIVGLDWYDGFTSGIVRSTASSRAFRFDLITWGPGQDRRVFALAAIPLTVFDEVVRIHSELKSPTWPVWWPFARKPIAESERINREADAALNEAGKAEFAIETDSLFQTFFAGRRISDDAPELPESSDWTGFLDNYDNWHRYLGLSA